VPDRQGNFGDVVLGCDDLQGYLNEHPCFGATIVAMQIGLPRDGLPWGKEKDQQLEYGNFCSQGKSIRKRLFTDFELG
jgi:hypothetical protein